MQFVPLIRLLCVAMNPGNRKAHGKVKVGTTIYHAMNLDCPVARQPSSSLGWLSLSLSQDNLGLFREELKESSQALSDILGGPRPTSAVGLTPQLEDDEIPVLPSAKPGSAPITPLTVSAPTSVPAATSNSKPPLAMSLPPSSSITASHPHLPTPSQLHTDMSGENGADYGTVSGLGQGTRKRPRQLSSERTTG